MFDQCLYFNTMALGRQLDRIWTRAFKPFDLTPQQAFMLRAILKRPGMLQNQLADELRIARATTTRAIDGLAARGFVERRTAAGDKRECEIHPLPAAVAIGHGLDQASGAVTMRLKALLGAGNFTGFVEQAKAISTAID